MISCHLCIYLKDKLEKLTLFLCVCVYVYLEYMSHVYGYPEARRRFWIPLVLKLQAEYMQSP